MACKYIFTNALHFAQNLTLACRVNKNHYITLPMPKNNTPMRILQVLPALKEGGVEEGTLQIARYLQQNNIYSAVASAGGTRLCELDALGVTHFCAPLHSKNPFHILKNAFWLAHIIKQHNITLVHARSRAPAWSAYLACKMTHVAFLTTYHGTYNARNFLKRWYNSVMLRGDAVIAISHFIHQHILALHPAQKIPPVYDVVRGYNENRFDTKAISSAQITTLYEELNIPANTPLLTLVGRLTPWKGQHVLVEALADLKDLPWHALIAGGGKPAYRDKLVAQAAALGLTDRIHFLGSRTDTPLLYKASTIAFSTSTDPEAFGRVAVEAQAIGTPVIATNHGGSTETVQDGITGWLVTPNSAPDLAKKVRHALTHKKNLATMGEAGHKFVRSHFTASIMCTAELSVYKRCLNDFVHKNPSN